MHTLPRGRLTALVAIFSCSALGLLAQATAQSAADDTLAMSYTIYVGGAKVYKVKYRTTLAADRYSSRLSMGPKGLGKVFSDYELDMTATGAIGDGAIEPQAFTLEASEEGEEKSVEMTWSGSGIPDAQRSFDVADGREKSLEKALSPTTPDPLTAALHHGLAAQEPCGGTERAYNGSEVYDLRFELIGKEVLRGKKADAFKGEVFKCRVVWAPVAGYSDRKMKRYSKKLPAYTVWFAPVDAPVTGRRMFVPVGAEGEAAGRNFTAVASEATLSGEPLVRRLASGD
jgi:hypothetical protein